MLVRLTLIALGLSAAMFAACSGDDDDPVATPTAVIPIATPRDVAPPSSTRPEGTLAVPTAPARPDDAPFTLEDATAMLEAVLIQPADLPPGWMIQADATTDNAAAAAASPDQAASNERCGRLLSRLITNFPEDSVAAFLEGSALAFFSTATVYEDAAGAADCGAENAARLAEPGALAQEFGQVFIDPLTVVVELVEYPAVGDGSFAAYLTGQIDASGMQLEITILVVGFARGNATAAVGSAYSGINPPTAELEQYVDAVLARIEAWQ
jgi:hypothetical protein